MKMSAALSPQCHLHIHCDPVVLLLGLDVNVKSMPVPPAVLCQPQYSLFSRCHHAAHTQVLCDNEDELLQHPL